MASSVQFVCDLILEVASVLLADSLAIELDLLQCLENLAYVLKNPISLFDDALVDDVTLVRRADDIQFCDAMFATQELDQTEPQV